MEQIVYNNVLYTRKNGHWLQDFEIVYEGLQKILDRLYAETCSTDDLMPWQMYEIGKEFKDNGSYTIAVKHFKKSFSEGGIQTKRMVLPCLTSCYRNLGNPDTAIKIFEAYKNYTSLISVALLTSAAAAYLDTGDREKAVELAYKALRMNHGRKDHEMFLLFQRINAA